MINMNVAPTSKSPNFEDVVDTISKLVTPHVVGSTDERGEIEFPGWDGNVRAIELEPVVASEVGLGRVVRARVIGDYETGVAVILRSLNIFDTRHYGLWIQPTQSDEGVRGFEVWQAPAQKPERGKAYWGIELLDRNQAKQSSPEVTQGFIDSLNKVQ